LFFTSMQGSMQRYMYI